MTENQLKYLAYQESMRHNIATEMDAQRKTGETERANRADEELKRSSLDETKRSNLAKEGETHRSNMANEAETHRANVARETETNRTNIANEGIKRQQITAKAATDAANLIPKYIDAFLPG